VDPPDASSLSIQVKVVHRSRVLEHGVQKVKQDRERKSQTCLVVSGNTSHELLMLSSLEEIDSSDSLLRDMTPIS